MTNNSSNNNLNNNFVRTINAHWCSLGTSITWYNDDLSKSFTKGYQTRVMEKLLFTKFTNKGVNSGVLESTIPQIIEADIYTIGTASTTGAIPHQLEQLKTT